ncbi:Olfactory receptor 12D3 [Sciurus carolinensis]|uniref:Olfactory receptor n=1 Tax=Sciurus carolinensis TaxID=30640 RepID=A0AA41NK95_SCICA|nr:olfactory receptor 12D3 [Sciurus carolinensis]MBZ3891881.1 Olfactory receptor 12D3 [Sciurus carolinensis]
MENVTTVDEFLLLSLTSVQELQPVFFVIFLIIYLINLVGNGAILMIVILEPKLHSPMYFFLGNLSCLDLGYSSVTLPKVLMNLLSTRRAISFLGCIAQLHFFHFLGSTEAILLAVMAFDRFVAICNPLRYTVIMKPQLCVLLAAVAWLISFFYALMHSVLTARLNFCHSLKLNHFFCDVKPLLELACSNTELNQWLLSAVTGSISMGAFFLTLLSYFYIIGFLLLKNRSCRTLHKALSTCASHFMVVCLFYGPVGFTYIRPASVTSMSEDRTVAVIYSAVTPVLNPLIYTLRNKEVMLALKKIFRRKLFKDCQ